MDNYQGDLTDIVRGTGTGPHPLVSGAAAVPPPASSASLSNHVHHSIPFSTCSDPLHFIPTTLITNAFGNPFSTLRDPLLTELDAASSNYFGGSPSHDHHHQLDAGTGTGAVVYNSSNIVQIGFPQMQISPPAAAAPPPKLPISPCGSPPVAAPSPTPRAGVKAPVVVPSDMINAKGRFLDGAQISSPRNLGIKKRKCQAKKVVCIPAPAAANSRSSGEVVPSDLWAWRKYGQKPIKGSPYPRGYYRCSSSKGCSARKQVERSRTDPNMLVITYTSEHNHSWPTQRNALAGSARSQPSSNSKTIIKNVLSPSSCHHQNKSCHDVSSTLTSDPTGGVKEEEVDEIITEKQPQLDNENEMLFSGSSSTADELHHQLFLHPCKPDLPDSSHNHQPQVDFFADLHELDQELLFPRPREEGDDDKKQKTNKARAAAGDNMDFNFFDWTADQDDKGGL